MRKFNSRNRHKVSAMLLILCIGLNQMYVIFHIPLSLPLKIVVTLIEIGILYEVTRTIWRYYE